MVRACNGGSMPRASLLSLMIFVWCVLVCAMDGACEKSEVRRTVLDEQSGAPGRAVYLRRTVVFVYFTI